MRLQLLAAALAGLACSNAGVAPVNEHTNTVSLMPAGPVASGPVAVMPPGPVGIAPAGPVAANPQPQFSASAKVELLPQGARRLDEVTSVHLVITLDGLSGAAPVAVQLTSPAGRSYQRLAATSVDNGQSTREIAFDLPVAGTAIENGMMSGQWSARFSVGATTLATQTFALDP